MYVCTLYRLPRHSHLVSTRHGGPDPPSLTILTSLYLPPSDRVIRTYLPITGTLPYIRHDTARDHPPLRVAREHREVRTTHTSDSHFTTPRPSFLVQGCTLCILCCVPGLGRAWSELFGEASGVPGGRVARSFFF